MWFCFMPDLWTCPVAG